MIGLVVGTIVEVSRNWKVAENPPCAAFLERRELAALAGASLGEPEVSASRESCIADWGAVRVDMRRVPIDEERVAFDRRAEAWRSDPGFRSLRRLDALDSPARLGVIEQIRFGGHARSVHLLVRRPTGWLEVVVTHHWPEPSVAPVSTADIEPLLVDDVIRHLPASSSFHADTKD